MSIWGGITGGLLGFVVLGPIGALVGSVIGSNISSRSKEEDLIILINKLPFLQLYLLVLQK